MTMKRMKHSKRQAEHGILKAYETLALAEVKSRDPVTNAAVPSDMNVEEARIWCRVNQK